MEVKKNIILALITICIPLSIVLFSDNSQYKQIGDTNFYLMPDAEGQGAFLYYGDGNSKTYLPITHKGSVHDVFWNDQFIILKCQQADKKPTKYWYILKNIKDYDWKQFCVKLASDSADYKAILDSMELNEKDMQHTNGKIRWCIHF